MIRLLAYCVVLVAGAMLCQAKPGDNIHEAELVRRSVVRIQAAVRQMDFREPWKGGSPSGGVGTGFIIAGNRIMTNAHVVSNQTQLQVNRDGDARTYYADVLFIAHDCDLAILKVKDNAEEFFRGSASLSLGAVPKLNSTVAAYGYPIGGKRMSVTRGIVSRIEFNRYTHIGFDAHLTVQVDAAINPGNSGGPVIQNGKVVGIAFQGYGGAVAQSTGYMIPTPVIRRMIKDVEDGSYDGYMELAVYTMKLQNPAMRKFLGLADDSNGVLVTDVMKNGSADGSLKTGDIILGIDGHNVDSAGNIDLDGEKVQMEEIVERKFAGDEVAFDILRDKKLQKVKVKLKKASPYRIYSLIYGREPRFVLFAGLLFQPINRNVMAAHKITDPDIKYHYDFFIRDNIYLERPELVALTSITPDPINSNLRRYQYSLVDEINGVKIKRLEDVAEAIKKKVKNHVIRLYRHGRPIIISSSLVADARARILKRYAINIEQRLKR